VQQETLETGDPATDQYLADLAEHKRRQIAHRCSAPIADIIKLVEYLEHDERKGFECDPDPDHIWIAVNRVVNWLSIQPSDPFQPGF
jgi:hypothetical protein